MTTIIFVAVITLAYILICLCGFGIVRDSPKHRPRDYLWAVLWPVTIVVIIGAMFWYAFLEAKKIIGGMPSPVTMVKDLFNK